MKYTILCKNIAKWTYKIVHENQDLYDYIEYKVDKGSGLEGWLKVKFISAVGNKICPRYTIKSGGAGHKQKRKKKYPDLIIEKNNSRLYVELKGATNWQDDLKRYKKREWLGVFIKRGTKELSDKQIRELRKYSKIIMYEKITKEKNGKSFYFGVVFFNK